MKDLTYAALLVLVLVLLAAVPASAAEETTAAPAPAADARPVLDATCAVPAPTPAAALGLEPAWHCPFNAPRCFKDDHCDAYCGDPRFGVCGSDGCCLCSG